MAQIVTITDTEKTGWIRFLVKEDGETIRDSFIKKSDFYQVAKRTKDSDNCIEIYILNKETAYYLTNNNEDTRFTIVDFVNGVAPVSLQDLLDKILALMPNS